MKMITLKETDDSILLLCEECVASRALHSKPEAVTFENSKLYAWLNGEFAEKYLSAEERERLQEVTLLSAEEAALFLPKEEQRGCRPNKNTVAEGVRVGGNGNCWWWLKTRGFAEDFYQIVDFAGHICTQGTYQTLRANGVRPAVRLKK